MVVPDEGPGPRRDRFSEWLNELQRAFHVRSNVIRRPSPFNGKLQKHQIGRLTLLDVSGSAYAAQHARDGNADYVSVVMSMRGSTNLVQRGYDVVLNPGDYCIMDSTITSQTTIPGPFHNVVARMPVADVTSILPTWQQSIGMVITSREGAASVFFDVVRSILRQPDALQAESHVGISNAAVDLLASTLLALPHNRKPSPSHMETFHRTRIKAFVQEHLRDPDLDVDMVASRLGLSPRHIHRLFKEEPQHLMHWVWSERLRHCYADLSRESQRNKTVAQIAYAWGFNDSAHFSRAFRHRYGEAPSDLRDRVLGK
jgi:AraC family transcriptional regulator, positive regulator of tynA and feaB